MAQEKSADAVVLTVADIIANVIGTSLTEEQANQLNAQLRKKSKSRAKELKHYEFVKLPTGKTPPQMIALAKAGQDFGGTFTGEELANNAVQTKLLQTRQEPVRIFAWYEKRMVEDGIIKLAA